MSEYAWISEAQGDPRLKRKIASKLTIDYFSTEERSAALEAEWQKESQIRIQDRRGAIRAASDYPKAVYGYRDPTESPTTYKKLPHMFFTGETFVSAEFAAVIERFDLAGGLYPVEVYQEDQKTRVPGTYFYLNIGATKDALLPDESPGVADMYGGGTLSFIDIPVKDDDVVLSDVAISGPDIWIDPSLLGCLFFSDRLWQAMKAAKVHTPFQAKRCLIAAVR